MVLAHPIQHLLQLVFVQVGECILGKLDGSGCVEWVGDVAEEEHSCSIT